MPRDCFNYNKIPKIRIADIPRELSYNHIKYLNSSNLHSVFYDIDGTQMYNLKQYIKEFKAGSTSINGYNLRDRQCASFAYVATQEADIKE
ncbi:hypothetical protein DKK70_09835 [Gilliamella apicola]|uniref:Uncharacterized protein n=1 Tax=Gilliamella apicola TaxID=1196095 RepID=A0A2V4E547_9GAMM|nr:hypothetical protein [Gilliamella apicola]PXZ06281.1 hypothetical protein DKK70_09835 [Gilliamella apicola]